MSNDEQAPPLLRVVAGGRPTPTELAALVVAVARRTTADAAEGPQVSRWNDRSSLLRKPLRPGRGAWRHSLR